MFAFYGAKKRLASKYPVPIYDTIIEPFAGSARYSLLYPDRNVILMEKDDIIYRVWKWLQNCSPSDILSLTYVGYGSMITDYEWPCVKLDGLWVLI